MNGGRVITRTSGEPVQVERPIAETMFRELLLVRAEVCPLDRQIRIVGATRTGSAIRTERGVRLDTEAWARFEEAIELEGRDEVLGGCWLPSANA